FIPAQQLIRVWVEAKADPQTRFPESPEPWKEWAEQLEQRARLLDPGLTRAIQASLRRIHREKERMEKKIHRAHRRRMDKEIRRMESLLEAVLPAGGLDERSRNFMEYYLDHGPRYFELIRE